MQILSGAEKSALCGNVRRIRDERVGFPVTDRVALPAANGGGETVTRCGRICFKGRKVNLSHAFAGQTVGVTQVGERFWLVTLMQYDLGYFDDETCRLDPIENPFGATLFTHPLRIN